MTERRVHLVSPAFHGYWSAIARALRDAGHTVTTCTYDLNKSWRERAWHQARHELPRRLGMGDQRSLSDSQTAKAVRSVREARPDAVVVVKGDLLGDDFWQVLDDARLPRVTWLYDEVRRTRFTEPTLARIGPIGTYSARDDERFRAVGLNSRYLPLAFDQHVVEIDTRVRNDEVVFIGARYPSRERALLELMAAGVPVRVFGRDWSRHFVDRLRTWRLTAPELNAGRDLGREDAYMEMAAALGAINMHGDQDGFTMRTFEACGVGGVQLIDRADVDGLYEPERELLCWSDMNELVALVERVAADHRWTERIRRRARERTLAEHTFDHRAQVLRATWDLA